MTSHPVREDAQKKHQASILAGRKNTNLQSVAVERLASVADGPAYCHVTIPTGFQRHGCDWSGTSERCQPRRHGLARLDDPERRVRHAARSACRSLLASCDSHHSHIGHVLLILK